MSQSTVQCADNGDRKFLFPHVFKLQDIGDMESYGVGDAARTLTEQRMSILSASLRSKPSWWIKYRDPSIRSKWKSEALEQVVLEGKLNEAEVDYVLAELEGYELLRDENTGAEVACFERIWQSDSLVPIDLRQLLVTEIAKLEDIPDEKKDWHPRSDNLVLDLVHPSLYCLVHGRTHGYTPGSDPRKRAPSDLQLLSPPEAPKKYSIQSLTGPDEYCISRKFSWIPTDFHIDDSGEGARAKSYINNLHPSHTELYHGIEMLIAKFSQLFNRVLTDLHPDNPLKQRTVGCYHYEDNGGRPRRRDGEDWDAYYLRLNEWEKNRPIVLPTVPTDGYSGGLNIRKSQYSIHGRDVQVIVKLANIQLTPEKPEYPGGSWHVEGMANECIVASGIYYYSSKNITSSHLAFRESVSFDEPYEQNDDEGVKKTWGLIRDGPCCQDLGSIETIEGRCIAFPNIYQHRVSSFRLVDPTKPGYRKIIALFLIDPSRDPIPSTTNIPPQQAHWTRSAINDPSTDTLFHKLPTELLDIIAHNVSTTMTEEEAKKCREDLMDERSHFVQKHDKQFFQAEFDLCEH